MSTPLPKTEPEAVASRELLEARVLKVSDLLKQIPLSWRDADITVGNSIGDAAPVRRVALHRNSDGRKVVVIYDHKLMVK